MADQAKKNKGGRPKEDVAQKVDLDQIQRIASLGMTDEEIGYVLDYSERTINRWKKNPRFLSALKKGKAKADAKVIESLYRRATGYEHKATKFFQYEGRIISQDYIERYAPDPTSLIFWLKNRRPDEFKDRHEVTGQGVMPLIDEVIVTVVGPRKPSVDQPVKDAGK